MITAVPLCLYDELAECKLKEQGQLKQIIAEEENVDIK
jgi:hypothetical protein